MQQCLELKESIIIKFCKKKLVELKIFFYCKYFMAFVNGCYSAPVKIDFFINKVLLLFGSRKKLGKVKVSMEHKKSHILQHDRNTFLKFSPLPFLYQHFQFIGLFLCVMLSIYSFKYLCTFQFFPSFLALLLPSLQKLFYPHHKYTYKGFPNKAKLKCRISRFEVTMLMEYMGEDTATRQDVYLERETEAHPSLS